MLHRFDGIADAALGKLVVIRHGAAQAQQRQTAHLQPVLPRRQLRRGLMGRDIGGDNMKTVQPQLLHCMTAYLHMAQMDGIEGAAVKADPSHFSPLRYFRSMMVFSGFLR